MCGQGVTSYARWFIKDHKLKVTIQFSKDLKKNRAIGSVEVE